MEDFEYIPNMGVITSARAFIRNLCETYGSQQGMAVWDHIRQGLGDQIASDIFLGMLTSNTHITVHKIDDRFIEVIREIRHFTGWSLKESKDFCDNVRNSQPGRIGISHLDDQKVDMFISNLKKIGCDVR